MKKLLIVIVVLAGSSIAAYMYYNPLEKPQVADTESTDAMPVVSTAPEAAEPAEAAEAAEADAQVAEAEGEEAAPVADENTPPDQEAVIAKLAKTLGGIPQSSIKVAPMPGWYEVARGSAIGYVSEDGQFLLDGDLIDLKSKVNLTDKRRSDWRKSIIAGIDESQMIIFEPEKVKHTITVFTDVDCGYCRKLHSHMKEYLADGIRIRYVFYPLRGENAPSFQTAERVWCSADRQEALTQAKLGKEITTEICKDNPVAMHLQAGMTLGIRGTPGVLTEDGRLLPGYMPPDVMLKELEKS